MDAIGRLEKAIERAENNPVLHVFTVTALLTEIYRTSQGGFTDDQADAFEVRLTGLCNSVENHEQLLTGK